MSTTIDEKALAEYEALCASPDLTPGPLTARFARILPSEEIQASRVNDNLDFLIAVCYGKDAQTNADARFFALSRTMGPLLAAKVREQAKEIDGLRAAVTEAGRLLREAEVEVERIKIDRKRMRDLAASVREDIDADRIATAYAALGAM